MTIPSRAFRSASIYFLSLLAVGWILGPIREFLLAPRIGEAAAHGAEGGLLFVIVFLIARRVSAGLTLPLRAFIGCTAAVALVTADSIGAIVLRGQSLFEVFAPIDFRLAILRWGLFAWAGAAPAVSALAPLKLIHIASGHKNAESP